MMLYKGSIKLYQVVSEYVTQSKPEIPKLVQILLGQRP